MKLVRALSRKLEKDLSDMKKRDQLVGETTSISPEVLFVDAINAVPEIPTEIELCLEIDSDVPHAKVHPGFGSRYLTLPDHQCD
jgi:hypothetical protein